MKLEGMTCRGNIIGYGSSVCTPSVYVRRFGDNPAEGLGFQYHMWIMSGFCCIIAVM